MPEPHIFDAKADKALDAAKLALLQKIADYPSDAERCIRWALAYAALNGDAPNVSLPPKS